MPPNDDHCSPGWFHGMIAGMSEALRKKQVWIVLCIALFIRLLIPVLAALIHHDPAVYYADDTLSYLQPAREMLAQGTFTQAGRPELFRTPGYPILLIPGLLLGGVAGVTIALQVVLGTVTVLLVYRLGMLVFANGRIAFLAMCLYAIEPLAIIFCGLLLSETLFTAVMVSFLICFVRFIRAPFWRYGVPAAVLLAATVYIRPVSLYLFIPLTLVAVGYFLLSKNKQGCVQALVFGAIAFLLPMAWTVRNRVVAGYSGFASVSDVNLYAYSAAAVLAARDHVSYLEMMDAQNRRAAEYQRAHGLTEGQVLQYMRGEGVRIIMSNPLTYAGIHVKGMVRMTFDPAAVEYLKMLKLYPHRGGLLGQIIDRGIFAVALDLMKNNPVFFWAQVLLFIQLVGYYFLFIFYFFGKVKMPAVLLLVLLVFLGYMVIIAGGPNSLDRFRHPLMPVVCLFAGAGGLALWERVRKKRMEKEKAGPEDLPDGDQTTNGNC